MNFFKKFSKNLNSKENQELKVNDIESLENQELKVNDIEPLKGYEECSPQFQDYMRRKIAADEAKRKTELIEEKECFPIEDYYSLSDNEIIEELHDLTKPIYPILNEIKIKLKDWMPDEELADYENLKTQIEDYFLFDYEDLNEIISGFLYFEDYDEDEKEPYEIKDHLRTLALNLAAYSVFYGENASKFPFIEENLQLLQEIKFEFFRIYWSAFGINEDLTKVKRFFEKYLDYDFNGTLTKIQKERYEGYQKAYFYSKKNVVRAAKIFKRFEKEKTAKINVRDIPLTKKEDDLIGYGFVYFIRNKDIHKIGITQNMLQRMEQLKPDELLDSVRCSNYKELEREIHNKFKGCRIPQTEYFRLEKEEISEIHQLLKDKAK